MSQILGIRPREQVASAAAEIKTQMPEQNIYLETYRFYMPYSSCPVRKMQGRFVNALIQ